MGIYTFFCVRICVFIFACLLCVFILVFVLEFVCICVFLHLFVMYEFSVSLCVSVRLFESGLVYIFERICAYLCVFIRRCVYLCVKCVFLKSILEPLLSVTVFTLSFALRMHETVMLPTLGKSEIKISCGTIRQLNTLTHKLTHTHILTQNTYRVPQTKEMIFTH